MIQEQIRLIRCGWGYERVCEEGSWDTAPGAIKWRNGEEEREETLHAVKAACLGAEENGGVAKGRVVQCGNGEGMRRMKDESAVSMVLFVEKGSLDLDVKHEWLVDCYSSPFWSRSVSSRC